MAVWKIVSPTDITLRMILKGHERYVMAVDLSETTIISGSADNTIKVHHMCCNYIQQVCSVHVCRDLAGDVVYIVGFSELLPCIQYVLFTYSGLIH